MAINKELIQEFLDTIFDPEQKRDDEHILLWADNHTSPSFPLQQEKQFWRHLDGKLPRACYVSTATVTINEEGHKRNRLINFANMWCFVLDDVGEGEGSKVSWDKLPDKILDAVSFAVETSPGNWQLGFLFCTPIDCVHQAKQFIKLIYGMGFGDTAGAMPNKLIRLPCGFNLKPQYKVNDKHFEVGMDEDFFSGKTNTPAFYLEVFDTGVTWDDVVAGTADQKDPKRRRGTTAFMDGVYHDNLDGVIDVGYEWLNDNGHIVCDNGGEWITIVCPWADQHSDTDDNVAYYKPLGRGDNPEARYYKCHHSHTEKTHDFLAWMAKEDGPMLPMIDPVAPLIARYALCMKTNRVVDMKSESFARLDMAGFKNGNQHKIYIPKTDGKPAGVTVFDLWVQHTHLLKLVGQTRSAGGERLIHTDAGPQINSYSRPYWGAGAYEYDEFVQPFVDFIHYLFPDPGDAEWFIGHLSAKVKDPRYRGLAIFCHTSTQGSGRGTLAALLAMLFGAWNISDNINITKLIKGIDGGNNEFLACDFLVTAEAEQAVTSENKQHQIYNTLKSFVEPAVISFPIQDKYIKQYYADINASMIICSQNASALHIDDGDRRFVRMMNTLVIRSRDYFAKFRFNEDSYMNSEWQPHVWRYLLQLDLTEWDPECTHRREKNSEEQLEQQRATASPVDYIVQLALKYVDERCQGVLHIPTVMKWITKADALLNTPEKESWLRICETKLRDLTVAIKDDDERAIKFKIGGKSVQARCTTSEIGRSSLATIKETGARGKVFGDAFSFEHETLFPEFCSKINEE